MYLEVVIDVKYYDVEQPTVSLSFRIIKVGSAGKMRMRKSVNMSRPRFNEGAPRKMHCIFILLQENLL